MLSKEQQEIRNKNIKLHRNTDTKHHAYLLKFDDVKYQQLKTMAGDGTISNVINKGINDRWTYYLAIQSLISDTPTFKSSDEVERWRMDHLKGSPALIAKYVKAESIMEYTSELKKNRKIREDESDIQDTTAYLLKMIGNNINQIARKANSGVDVPREDLRRMTKAVLKLIDVIKDNRKEVT